MGKQREREMPIEGQSHWCEGWVINPTSYDRRCRNIVSNDSDHCEAGHKNIVRNKLSRYARVLNNLASSVEADPGLSPEADEALRSSICLIHHYEDPCSFCAAFEEAPPPASSPREKLIHHEIPTQETQTLREREGWIRTGNTTPRTDKTRGCGKPIGSPGYLVGYCGDVGAPLCQECKARAGESAFESEYTPVLYLDSGELQKRGFWHWGRRVSAVCPECKTPHRLLFDGTIAPHGPKVQRCRVWRVETPGEYSEDRSGPYG
jgi:hypothetical protein